MNIYCCACQKETDAKLVSGKEVYSHRPDLYSLPFWMCPTCSNFVGCHHKTKDRTKPLGVIPTQEIKNIRIHIHSILDPLWKSKIISRSKAYSLISDFIGKPYHTGEIASVKEAIKILQYVKQLKNELTSSK